MQQSVLTALVVVTAENMAAGVRNGQCSTPEQATAAPQRWGRLADPRLHAADGTAPPLRHQHLRLDLLYTFSPKNRKTTAAAVQKPPPQTAPDAAGRSAAGAAVGWPRPGSAAPRAPPAGSGPLLAPSEVSGQKTPGKRPKHGTYSRTGDLCRGGKKGRTVPLVNVQPRFALKER